MQNFMMLQQLQVLQQPLKRRPIFKKLRKIAANFVKILKYSIKSHKIPRVYHLKCDLYFVQILVICCNCMGCSSCMDCNNCMYCGNFKILAISWLCWMKFCVCILRHSLYILKGLILLKTSLLQFAANLDHFVANWYKSETKQWGASKVYR